MTPFYIIILVCVCFAALVHLLGLVSVSRASATMPRLENMSGAVPANAPKLSVIIPACNEAESLEESMKSRLATEYPHIEFILVDDRSTDGTRDIARRIAATDPRVKLVEVDHLPPGWLGKVHAMHVGVGHATGDWYLFSDADVVVRPGTLTRVMNWCLENKLDHVAIFPEFHRATFWVDTVVSVVIRALAAVPRTWKIKDPNSRASAGAGVFNLVRRSAFEKTPGFEWLKMEIVDDVALGQMMKKNGGRSDILNGRGYVGVCWYRTFPTMARGVGRGITVGLANFNPLFLLVLGGLFMVTEILPLLVLFPAFFPMEALFPGVHPSLTVSLAVSLTAAGLLALTSALAASLVSARMIHRSLRYSFLAPLGSLLLFFIALTCAVTIFRDGGLKWRETFYDRRTIRRGRRITF